MPANALPAATAPTTERGRLNDEAAEGKVAPASAQAMKGSECHEVAAQNLRTLNSG
jgi:hypothetical protein